MSETMREVVFALRRLVRAPAYSLATLLTLAPGIGASTAIFGVVNGVLLKPLPYPDADRLALITHIADGRALGMPDEGYFQYAEHARSFEELAIYYELSAPVVGTGEPWSWASSPPPRLSFACWGSSRPWAAPSPKRTPRPAWMTSPSSATNTGCPTSEAIQAFWMSRWPRAPAFPSWASCPRASPSCAPRPEPRSAIPSTSRAPEAYSGGHTVTSLQEGGHRPVLAASLVPAQRATRVDPPQAMRAE